MPYYDRNALLKTLDVAGVGAKKQVAFTLENTTVGEVLSLIKKVAANDGWKLERDETLPQHAYQEWAAGGLSVSGYQTVSVTLNQHDAGVRVEVQSRSRVGQLKDWGANEYNVSRMQNYMTNPQMDLGPRKVPGERSGVASLLVFAGILLFTFVLLMLLDF